MNYLGSLNRVNLIRSTLRAALETMRINPVNFALLALRGL